MTEKEGHIRFIRSRLPYMDEENLRFVVNFIRGLSDFTPFPNSPAEWGRPVLSAEDQKKLDNAQLIKEGVEAAVADGFIIGEAGQKILGELHGEAVAVAVSTLSEIMREYHYARIRKADMLEGLEYAGYILPRCCHPKTSTIGNSRKETVYIPMNMIKSFVGKEVEA